MNRGAVVALGSVLVLVLGFALGRATAPSPDPSAPVAPPRADSPTGAASRPTPSSEMRDRLTVIEGQLERIEEALAAEEPGTVASPEIERIREVWKPVIVEAVHLAEIESYRQRVLPELDRLLKLRRTGFTRHGARSLPDSTRKAVEMFERRRRDLLEMATLAELEAFKPFARVYGLPFR